MIKKISRLVSSCLIVLFALVSHNVHAEYYLVYSGGQSSCASCYWRYHPYKKVTFHRPSYPKHRVISRYKSHNSCQVKPHHQFIHTTKHPLYTGAWVPAYWENGSEMPGHKFKRIATGRADYSRHKTDDYNLDLTTGDDNPYVNPGMDIDY